jgi:hypothetical protein
MGEQKPDEWLFGVEEVFNLSGLGLVIVLDLQPSDAILRVGDALTFLCTDGREIETRIKSFPLIHRAPHLRKFVLIELPKTPETLQIQAGDQAFRRVSMG